ncbi:hypothetical protein PGT21_000862 [Puccinia graminis f. sp. tritici]|uniref:Uncharacterized protein n=1 Tax=Puccinia graminis f. sp. tritici TaxID=56615 RepID=A0A5B0QMX7_PUCGR|nr:hypothetical protein PGT21_000862 [Puccinia graminis f. sp. tritici]
MRWLDDASGCSTIYVWQNPSTGPNYPVQDSLPSARKHRLHHRSDREISRRSQNFGKNLASQQPLGPQENVRVL